MPRQHGALWAIILFAVSISGLPDSVVQAQHVAWTKCRHTGQRIARFKPCPCGCTKHKGKVRLRLLGERPDCADDLVVRAPHFTKLVAVVADSLTLQQHFDHNRALTLALAIIPPLTLASLKPG